MVVVAAEVVGNGTSVIESAARGRINGNRDAPSDLDRRTRVGGDRDCGQQRARMGGVGYTGKPFAAAAQGKLGASVEVVKRSEPHTFVALPKRWVVERSFAWLEKRRRLWKNCERKLNTSLRMVALALAALILKRL